MSFTSGQTAAGNASRATAPLSTRPGIETPLTGCRVVYFGMPCAFSAPPLSALRSAGADIRLIVHPAPPGAFGPPFSGKPSISLQPVISPADPSTANVPVLTVDRNGLGDLANRLAGHNIDVLVTACFPWKIPATLIASARFGGLNVHPSLLPRHRGPEPLFWAFRTGDRETGVSIHRLTDRYDAGPQLARVGIPLPAGSRLPDVEGTLAELGGRSLVSALANCIQGTAREIPQAQTGATWAPIPTSADLNLTTNWPAERAFTFVRGVASRWGPLWLLRPGHSPLAVVDAFNVVGESGSCAGNQQDGVTVEFPDGTVTFRTASQPSACAADV